MSTYTELVNLAKLCMAQARIASNPEITDALRRLAKKYQQQAAAHNRGKLPAIDDDDSTSKTSVVAVKPAGADHALAAADFRRMRGRQRMQ